MDRFFDRVGNVESSLVVVENCTKFCSRRVLARGNVGCYQLPHIFSLSYTWCKRIKRFQTKVKGETKATKQCCKVADWLCVGMCKIWYDNKLSSSVPAEVITGISPNFLGTWEFETLSLDFVLHIVLSASTLRDLLIKLANFPLRIFSECKQEFSRQILLTFAPISSVWFSVMLKWRKLKSWSRLA